MLKLEDIRKDASVNGIMPGQVVRVVTTEPAGDNTLTVYYRTSDGQFAERMLFRTDEPSLSLADAGRPWAFDAPGEPLYVVPAEKKAQVKKLKDLLANASELYLATDEDREGEAIAWHLHEVLKPKVPVKRMVFHEITKKAIKHAIATPRTIDAKLVDAQETRRILDRLYGYEVSPVLWRKIAPRLSAGRVQSVATRLIVERERLRLAFHSGSYYGLTATLVPTGTEVAITAELVEAFGKKVATSRDFDAGTGALTDAAQKSGTLQIGKDLADGLAAALPGARFAVADVQKKPFTQKPYPPFITSSLQQESARKLRFTAQRTMRTCLLYTSPSPRD